MKNLRVAIVNRFYPPDPAVTGVAATELAQFLRSTLPALHYRVFCGVSPYVGGIRHAAHTEIGVVRLGAWRAPRGRLGRLMTSLIDGRRMAKAAVGWADAVISLTDPPLLGFWIGRELARRRDSVRWLEWTMDLYPEAFAAAGLIDATSPIYRYVQTFQRLHLPDAYLCLGTAQAAAVRDLRGQHRPTFLLPCGVIEAPTGPGAEIPQWRRDECRVVLAYAGNIGEAHCPHILPALVDIADPARFLFVFSLYGAHAGRIRQQLAGRRNIVWPAHLSHAELAHADVHIASLLPAWTHICVPSKAISTICLGRPLLFVGAPESDIATVLAGATWAVPVSPSGVYDETVLVRLLERIADPAEREVRRAAAVVLARGLVEQKARAFDAVAAWLDTARSMTTPLPRAA